MFFVFCFFPFWCDTVHDRFADAVEFSFNYNTLLLVASILAGLGLVSNSSATIIASMLVSPIMGPVVGLAYGTTICDWKMVKRSIRTECISLIFCILVGTVIGAITGPTDLAEDWPTSEMSTVSLHISEPTRIRRNSYAVFCLKKKKKKQKKKKTKKKLLLQPSISTDICNKQGQQYSQLVSNARHY